MPSKKEYLQYVLDILPKTVTYRYMMGEYVLYYDSVVFGGVYDDRFLVKSTHSSNALLPNACKELPYDGGKEMLLVDDEFEEEFFTQLLEGIVHDLKSKR